MAWVKVDDHFPEHPKVAGLGDWAPVCGWLWLCALAYCNRQLTDGRIPKAYLPRLASFHHLSIETGSVADLATMGEDIEIEYLASLLIGAGLWEEDDYDYIIHDYPKYQPTRAQVIAQRQAVGVRVARFRSNAASNEPVTPLHSVCNGVGTQGPVPGTRYPVPGTRDPGPDAPFQPESSGSPGHLAELTCPTAPEKSGAHARKSREPKPYSEEFEHFWSIYPRHEKKPEAWKAWQARLRAGEDQAIIFRATEVYAGYLRDHGTETEFIKLAATWVGPSCPWRDWVNGSPRGPTRPAEPKGFAGIRAYRERRQREEGESDAGGRGEADGSPGGSVSADEPW